MAHRSTRKGKRSTRKRSRTTRRQRGGEEVPQLVLEMIESNRSHILREIMILHYQIIIFKGHRQKLVSSSTRNGGLYERLCDNLEGIIKNHISNIRQTLGNIRQLRNFYDVPIPQDEQEWAEKYEGATIESLMSEQPAPPREFPRLVIPKNTENIITANVIQNGNILTNFRGNAPNSFESKYGYYYKKGTVNSLRKHPRTRGLILNKKNYKAKIANNSNNTSLNRVQTNLFA